MQYRLIILSLLCFCSCTSRIDLDLGRIEKQIEFSPDSALLNLERIHPQQLLSPSSKAKYALLKSMVYDKNYIDVSNDSLINIAVNYYTYSKRYPKYKMLSYYYKGIVQKNSGNYPGAIISFEQAERLAEQQRNYRYLGLIYRNTAEIFNLTNNAIAATDYHLKAIDAFSENKDSIYVRYAMYSLAVDLMEDGKYDESRGILKQLISDSDDILKWNSSLCYAQTCVELEDSIYRALNLYKEIPIYYYRYLDFGYRSMAHLLVGQLDSANFWMIQGLSVVQTPEEKATLEFVQADIERASNRPELAFGHLKRAAFVQDSLTRDLLHQSLSIAQRDYYRHEVSLQSLILKRQKTTMLLSVIVVALLFIIAFLFFREWQRKKESDLKDAITKLEMENRRSGINVSALIGTLFLEKYAHLDIHTISSLEKDGVHSIKDFKKELYAIGENEDAFKDLYDMLNHNANNIIEKLTMQIGPVYGYNLKLISLYFANVPDEITQYIMRSHSTGSLRTSRSRFRTIIKNSKCPDEDLFLSYLERQPRKKI